MISVYRFIGVWQQESGKGPRPANGAAYCSTDLEGHRQRFTGVPSIFPHFFSFPIGHSCHRLATRMSTGDKGRKRCSKECGEWGKLRCSGCKYVRSPSSLVFQTPLPPLLPLGATPTSHDAGDHMYVDKPRVQPACVRVHLISTVHGGAQPA